MLSRVKSITLAPNGAAIKIVHGNQSFKLDSLMLNSIIDHMIDLIRNVAFPNDLGQMLSILAALQKVQKAPRDYNNLVITLDNVEIFDELVVHYNRTTQDSDTEIKDEISPWSSDSNQFPDIDILKQFVIWSPEPQKPKVQQKPKVRLNLGQFVSLDNSQKTEVKHSRAQQDEYVMYSEFIGVLRDADKVKTFKAFLQHNNISLEENETSRLFPKFMVVLFLKDNNIKAPLLFN